MGNYPVYRLVFFCCFQLFLFQSLSAQDVPNTQLYLFDYELSAEGALNLSAPRWFSSFNPDGYNNQPYFANGWWYFSARMVDSMQNDIYAGNVRSGEMRQLTATQDSEYSPTPIGSNKISVVRVEKDESQRLWAYTLGDEWNREVLFPEIRKVGYHKWLNDSTAALFMVSDPVSLQLATDNGSLPRFITSKIGRGLALNSNGKIYFTQRMVENNPWQLKSWSPGDNRPKSILPCPPGGVDFTLLNDQYVLMSSEQKFYLLNLEDENAGWKEVMDFSTLGWTKVTRIATNENGQMMVVVNLDD